MKAGGDIFPGRGFSTFSGSSSAKGFAFFIGGGPLALGIVF